MYKIYMYIYVFVYKTIYIIYIMDTLDQLAGPKKGPPESDTGPVGLVPTVWEMLDEIWSDYNKRTKQ